MSMPLSRESGREDQQLVQYLLGLLPSEEAERLDESSIADDGMAARLRTVEHDLIDAYVRGALAGATLERFESHYLSSPRRREQVAFARRFVSLVDREAVAARSATGRSWIASRLVSRSAVAAVLLLAASGALWYQTVRPRTGTNVVQGKDVGLELKRANVNLEPADTRPAKQPKQPVISEPDRARELAPAAEQASPAVALLLLPQTRSAGSIPALAIPAGADRVGFELRLESTDFPRYQAGLRDPSVNKIVWRSGWIATTPSAGQASVRVAVPAAVLKPQHYSLDLTGRGSGGSEVAGSYVFEIMPR